MYCRNCGKPIGDDFKFCPLCGTPVGKVGGDPADRAENRAGYSAGNGAAYRPQKAVAPDDAPSGGFTVLCFLIPVLGLILWLIWEKDYPQKAHSCAKGGLGGLIFYFVLGLLLAVLTAVGMFAWLGAFFRFLENMGISSPSLFLR